MSPETINYYEHNAQEYSNNTIHADMKGLYEQFISRLKPGALIVDAGCGSGRDSLYFIDQGFKVIAFDASKNLAQLASNHIRQEVIHATFKDIPIILPEGSVDAVWCMASLLHLPELEIKQALIDFEKSLKPEGVFFAAFKYGNEELVDKNNRFFSNLNEKTATELFQSTNLYNPIEINFTGDALKRQETQWINIISSVKKLKPEQKTKIKM